MQFLCFISPHRITNAPIMFALCICQLQVSQERLLQYIHFNRHHNTMLINDAVKQIGELKAEIAELRQDHSLPKTPQSSTDSPEEVERRNYPFFPIVWDEEEVEEEEKEE